MCPQVRQSQPAPSPFQPSQPSQPCRASVAGAVAVTYARLLATPPDVPPMRDPREHVRSKSKKGFEGTVQEKTPLFCKRWSICGTVGGRAGDEPGGTHVIRWPRADACAGRCVWRAHACAELLHPSAFGFYPSFPFFYFSIFFKPPPWHPPSTSPTGSAYPLVQKLLWDRLVQSPPYNSVYIFYLNILNGIYGNFFIIFDHFSPISHRFLSSTSTS